LSLASLQHYAKKAIIEFIDDSLISVMNGRDASSGSATAISYRGATFLITADHVLPADLSLVRFMDSENSHAPVVKQLPNRPVKTELQTFGAPLRFLGSGRDKLRDVAFIHICENELKETLAKKPIDESMFSHHIPIDEWGMIHGFPNVGATHEKSSRIGNPDFKKRTYQQIHETVSWIRHHGLPALFADPAEYEMLDFPKRPLCDAEIFFSRDDTRPFSDFPGFSGGGIWTIIQQDFTQRNLFAASNACRLVGIQTDASGVHRSKHFLRGTKLQAVLTLIDEYLEKADDA